MSPSIEVGGLYVSAASLAAMPSTPSKVEGTACAQVVDTANKRNRRPSGAARMSGENEAPPTKFPCRTAGLQARIFWTARILRAHDHEAGGMRGVRMSM